MDDFRTMARDPEHRRSFEKLLYLALMSDWDQELNSVSAEALMS